jgi:hypothetical protein
MAGRLSLGFTSAAAAASACYAVLQNVDTSPGQRLRLYEVGFTTNANTLAAVGLAYVTPSNLGTPSGSPGLLTADDDLDTIVSKASVATAWSVAPVPLTTYKRMFQCGAVQGAGYVWSFPEGLVVSPTAGYALVNFGVGSGPSLSGWFAIAQ